METLLLDGTWRVAQVGTKDESAAQVPGCVHADLLAAGRIEDPFYRDNELAAQWVGEADWVFSRDFTVSSDLLAQDRVILRCEGLDTFATVTVNGTVLGETDNQFRTWEFDARPVLTEGVNRIEVRFASPVPYMQEKEAEHSLGGWKNAPHEIFGRSYVRKMPCNFGWDWGPALITCGIWRSISLVGFSTARLSDVHVRQDHARSGVVDLAIGLQAETTGAAALTASVVVMFDGREVTRAEVALHEGAGTALITVDDPHLWWPRGLGDQPLYDIEVTLVGAGAVLDTWRKRIGLRVLKLDRHPDQWGESFQFTANGVPFFAKGGNWIPTDAIYTRTTSAQRRDLLQSCVDANMNMLRVWGGGMYEYDEFYDICDELGLCVWQEFVFACASYPVFDPEFLANVKAEAEDNVRRLRHHASLAFWCGNNELEMIGLVSDDPERPHLMRWEPYRRLFDAILPEVVGRLDAEHDYWPSSSHTPGANRVNANDPTCGDAHLWGVWFERKPFEWYRTCEHRFNSEFGFQSFPEPLTVYGYTEEEDRNVTTVVMEHHQRSSIGNNAIIQYMLDWFRLPTRFDMMLWLSQVQQGMAMKYAVEHWRRSMPRGMGTLYWQVNDNWPVASWSSIDYHGRWKALHYMAKRFFAPILISGVEDLEAGTVEVHLTNDQRTAASGEAVWTLVNTDGKTLDSGSDSVAIDAQTSSRIATLDLSAYLATPGPRHILLNLEYLVDGKCVSSNLVHFARPKHLTLREPEISLRIEPQDAKRATVTLAVAKPALWAWLALDGVAIRASENYVHLMPGRTISIEVTSSEPLTDAQWQALQVYSLADTYGSACRCTGA